MKKDEFFKKLQIESPAKEIISLVEEKTGKNIGFIQNNNLQVEATVKIARKNMPQHIIYFKGEDTEILSHLIAHECGHILRILSVSEDKRLVPASNKKNEEYAFSRIKNDLPKFLSSLPNEALNKFFNMLIDGLIRQLTNLPVDFRIENWLHTNYADLRVVQKKSLDKSLKLAIQGLSKEIKQMVPYIIFEKSNLMNYAYAKAIDDLLGTDYASFYKDLPDLDLGEKLYSYLKEKDGGFLQDIKIINEWAGLLNLKEWFRWINFENMPDNYLTDIK